MAQSPGDRSSPPSESAPRRAASRGRGWLWLVLLIAAGAGGWWLYRGGHVAGAKPGSPAKGEQAATEKAVPVQAITARRSDVPVYLLGIGAVQAFNTVTVRSRVDGEIIKIAFTEGQIVKEGDLLAQIDPRPYQAVLDQALAKKTQDEAQLANTRADLARTQQLASREFASRQQLETQKSSVSQQMAQLGIDDAAIQSARVQLGYTTIKAPITGRTGFRLVDQGNIVRATDQTGIVQIAQLQPIAMVFPAPESELPALTRAMREGPVTVWALGSDNRKLAEGKLALINNEVDAASGTVRLKATFPNKDDTLWPGQSVTSRLLLRVVKGAVAIPDAAVQRGVNGLYAYVVKQDRKVEMRMLKVGPTTEGQTVIEDGIREGEQVVTAGQYRLQPETLVEITNAEERPGAAKSQS